METSKGFTRFDNITEFKNWLDKQNVNRKITKLQVHHTGLPDYSCFYKSNGKTEDELTRQQSIKDFHIKTNKWKDIAQHFTIFPNGKIVTGRNLEYTPVGITGWNTNSICIEIYGNFDKGKDIMTAEQKESVKAVYYYLSKKFKIEINSNNIKPHAWFTASGTLLNDYIPSKSTKSCAGTNFFGYGVSKIGFEKFIKEVKAYKTSSIEAGLSQTTTNKPKEMKIKVLVDNLAVRKVADWKAEAITKVKKGQYLIAVDLVDAKNGSTKMYKLESGLYITSSSKYIEKV